MDGECLDATVLQLLGQVLDDEVVHVPSQAGLRRDGCAGHGIDYGTCDGEHLRHVLQESGAGALAGHLLHRAAEVEVEHVRPRMVHDDAGRLAHGIDILAVYLHGHGTLVVADAKFLQALVHQPDEGVAGHEFGIDHSGSHLPAQQAETDICDILHRCQQHGALAQVDVSYLHRTGSGDYFCIALKARAYIFICLSMARRPLLRVGERCSRRPMRSMK